MKQPSFRRRIALLSATLTSTTLVSFGVLSWLLIYDARISRLDAELSSQLLQAGLPRSLAQWQTFSNTIPLNVGVNSPDDVALQITDRQGNTLYQSENWTAGLTMPLLPEPPPQAQQPQRPPRQTVPDHPNPPRFPYERPPNLPSSLPSDLPSNLPPGSDRPPSDPNRPTGTLPPPNLPPPSPQLATRHTATGAWRVGAIGLPRVQITIAVSLQPIDQEMAAIRNVFLIAIPVGFLLVAIGAWGLSGSALHPIRQLTTSIQNVSAKGLDQRLSLGTMDEEFQALIQVFNQMLERLDHSFQQASRFSADAAHELKTPLTILQGELERTLQQAEPESPLQQRLSGLLDEVRRLSTIVRKLLLLSLADAGQMSLYRVGINVSELLITIAEDIELLAPDLSVKTTIPTGLRVQGDRDLLIQVLQNLTSNAVKYNRPQGWIQIHARSQKTTLAITITNASKDIPAQERSRIFDRFQRGDPARNRNVEGSGLGLSLAREIARAHGGDLTLDPTPPGQTAFTLQLPISSGSETLEK